MDNLLAAAFNVLTESSNDSVNEDQEMIAEYSATLEKYNARLYAKDGKFRISYEKDGKKDIPFSVSWQSNKFLRSMIDKIK
jgi:hypothetical protein